MKKTFIFLLVMVMSLSVKAQIQPEVYLYQPKIVKYDDSRQVAVNDYKWKIENQVWVKYHPNGNIELKFSSIAPVEFYSLGPVDLMGTDLIGFENVNRVNYYLEYISHNNKEYTYYSKIYRITVSISTDMKTISYRRKNGNYSVVNVKTDLNNLQNPSINNHGQPSPFTK